MPPPPADFTGREEELDEFLSKLGRGGVHISGLRGMGGVGKTTLALKLAELLAPRYLDAQFYLDLRGASPRPLSAADAMRHVILSVHPTAKLPEEEHALSALYRSVLHDRRALLLMDNAKDAAQLGPLIPPPPCLLVVTSRQRFTLPGLYAKDLDTLVPKDARALLLKIAPRLGESADEIAALCGYLPLALRLAASALAERPDLGPLDYVRRLSDSKQRLAFIEASVSLSYDLLGPELQTFWRTLSVFPDTFTSAAAAAVTEFELRAAQDALGELVRFSMVDWDESAARYGFHDLVRLFANGQLSPAERFQAQLQHSAFYRTTLAIADELYLQGGEGTMEGLALFGLEWTNIQKGQEWASENATAHDAAAKLCNGYADAGAYVLELRLLPRARIKWLEAALTAARHLGERAHEGLHLGNLGLTYMALGEATHAVGFYEQALEIIREISDRRGEGATLGNLAIAYTTLGETRRAIELYEERLEIAREIKDRRGECAALGNLGIAYGRLSEPRRAIELYEQALTIAREIGDRRGEGNSLGNLGVAYEHLGEIGRAIEFWQQHMRIAREIGDRGGEGNSLLNLARAFNDLGERDQAVQYGKAALRIYEEIEHPDAEWTRSWLLDL